MLASHTSASLEDFEHHDPPPSGRPSPLLRYPRERSGFLHDSTLDDQPLPPDDALANGRDAYSSSSAGEPRSWSPHGWRGPSAIAGSGWYRHQPYIREQSASASSRSRGGSGISIGASSRSRDPSRRLKSHDIDDEEDLTLPANIPLPRGSMSPDKERISNSPLGEGGTPSLLSSKANPEVPEAESGNNEAPGNGIGNYIRFNFRAEVQHRTEPIEYLVSLVQPHLDRPVKKRLSAALWVLLLSIIIWPFLTRTPNPAPAPDLVKLAGLARSLEPLMYYSENGVQHLSELQETGVAVWDLGESVRVANMSGAPTIVRELDDLAESLHALSIQLTQFFPAVDSDIDNVLLVMEWAKRELAALSRAPPSSLTAAVSNLHSTANYLGLLENKRTGSPTYAGQAIIWLFGMTPAQRSRATLHRTFHELLGALEESINTELSRTASLFALFATIDGQFHNLQRFTVRELDEQERQESELLSSLWQRVMGSNAARLKKFEKNRAILQSVRSRTVANKNLLVEHNGKLLALKESLETLRRRLMSPLVQGYGPGSGAQRSSDSSDNDGTQQAPAGDPAPPKRKPWAHEGGSSATLEDQIRGLDETHSYLRGVRQAQRGKVMEKLYGSGNRVRAQRLEISD